MSLLQHKIKEILNSSNFTKMIGQSIQNVGFSTKNTTDLAISDTVVGEWTSKRGNKLRPYQLNALEFAKQRSSIIVLPTGSGKTLIAAALTELYVNQNGRVLFLVPTQLLVQQQSEVLRHETGLFVQEVMGGKKRASSMCTTASVVVSTPDAFMNLLRYSSTAMCPYIPVDSILPSVSDRRFHFDLVIFDEVHHMIKKHPYTRVANHFNSLTDPPHRVGLTASLSYAMGEGIAPSIINLCVALNVGADCIFSDECKDLDDTEHNSSHQTIVYENDKFASSLLIGMPHDALQSFRYHIEYLRPPIHPLSVCLMETIQSVEEETRLVDGTFMSPMENIETMDKMQEWGNYAQKKCLSVGKNIAPYYHTLHHLYEAVRLLIVSQQTGLELSIHYLIMMGLLEGSNELNKLSKLWYTHKDQFSKLKNLKQILLDQFQIYGRDLRCIVFVQQRVVTHILHHFLMSDPDLKAVLKSKYLYATSTAATATLSLSKTQARLHVHQFSTASIQVLFSTNVAEEGIDIPAANCVVRFDAMQTPVSFIQSRGRARQANSSFIVMNESKSKTVPDLVNAESNQKSIIDEFSRIDHNLEKVRQALNVKSTNAKLYSTNVKKQQGYSYILQFFSGALPSQSELAVLNSYVQKVEAKIDQTVSDGIYGVFTAKIKLLEVGSEALEVMATGSSKKLALQNAALEMLKLLVLWSY
ncbi:P-loop containing nucleoside triphosphate hydrolase protein [Globomyces pollinis-pini]|nr:P-loop containing nucleoside triphosphate hydrolase protein [Globomyces pollinis-pini]